MLTEKQKQILLSWYDQNKRPLPWRSIQSPYRTWISEIMLQQTGVSTVIDYFNRWMKALPSIKKLASANEDQILQLWQGLGYYSRAKNILKTSKILLNEYQGKLPSDVKTLIKLPGIGPYSAGAIASISFNQKVPILDGNVVRILSRLFMIEDDVQTSKTKNHLWKLAEEILPKKGNYGDFNQALMELGATLCIPRSPKCEVCPLKICCVARKKNKVEGLPFKGKKIRYEKILLGVALFWHNGRVLMRRRSKSERMEGLWGFPFFEFHEKRNAIKSFEAVLKDIFGNKVEIMRQHNSFKHSITKFIIRVIPFDVKVSNSLNFDSILGEKKWMDPKNICQLPMSGLENKVLSVIDSNSFNIKPSNGAS